MAGLIYGWISKKNDASTIEFATAACALKHTIEGDVNTSTAEEVETLVKEKTLVNFYASNYDFQKRRDRSGFKKSRRCSIVYT